MSTFVLKYRDYRHGPDGVTIVIVNAETLERAQELAQTQHIELMDGGTHPFIDYEEYGDNCVVACVELNSDI